MLLFYRASLAWSFSWVTHPELLTEKTVGQAVPKHDPEVKPDLT